MTARLSNYLTTISNFPTGALGMEHGFAWNTWETGGSGPDVIGKWVGQDTLGRVYEKYRIINAITKFKWIPTKFSNQDTAQARYRGDVVFYVIQTNSATSPLTGNAPTWAGSSVGVINMKTFAQIPSVKYKIRRWGEVPQKAVLTCGQNLPNSTRIRKDPEYADDNGPYAGSITVGPTPTYTDPANVMYIYFGWFVPVNSTVTANAGDDFPSYKLELRDITLCTFTKPNTNSGLL